MRRKIFLLFMLLVLFVLAGFQLCNRQETWLRIEQNGLYFEPDYLHILAQKDRSELSVYLGNYISFVLPLDSVLYNAELEGFGEMESVMIFSLGDGKSFIVDSSGVDVAGYKSGDVLYIKAKLTAVAPDKVYILNSYGCPGWPNDITIKTMSQN